LNISRDILRPWSLLSKLSLSTRDVFPPINTTLGCFTGSSVVVQRLLPHSLNSKRPLPIIPSSRRSEKDFPNLSRGCYFESLSRKAWQEKATNMARSLRRTGRAVLTSPWVAGFLEGHAGTLQPTINRDHIASMSVLKAINLFQKTCLMLS
jgi:hypothetical protein